MKTAVYFIIGMAVLGLVGHQDQAMESKQATTDLINQMAVVCHAGNTPQCQQLINEVQSKNYEVLNNAQGYFWAEAK